MNIISVMEVLKINRELEKELHKATLHVRDACGSQSFTIKYEDDVKNYLKEEEDSIKDVIEEHFKTLGFKVVYSDKANFTISRFCDNIS